MIERVELSGFPCFAEDEALSSLTAVNFIFGPNGSGKTTISQSLSSLTDDENHVRWASTPQTVKVYNRDYVRKAFTSADGEERGVFLLGEDSADTFTEIKQLEDLHEKTTDRIRSRRKLIEESEAALVAQRDALAGKVWDRRSVIPDVIRREMTGLNGSKANCLELTLEKARQFPERGKDTFESLAPQAEAAFSQSVSELESISQAPAARWDEDALRSALKTPIIGSSDVPLADFIDRLGISDWVQQGVEHLHGQEDRPMLCPFCQQIAPEELGHQLSKMFDDTYQKKRDEVEAFQRDIALAAEALADYKERNLTRLRSIVEPVDVDRAFTEAEVGLESISTSVEQKVMKPSDVVDVGTASESYAALKSVVDTANSKIDETNATVRDRRQRRPAILNAAWQEFVRGYLDDLVTAFLNSDEQCKAKVGGLQRGITQQQEYLQQCETMLRELRARTTSSERTIQAINDMLEMGQFHSFKLGKAQRTIDGYRIIRDDGEPANIDSLSEGERTFVTFLYFYHSLAEVRQDSETEKVCAVIDDPISSLDGDIMFVVSALMRQLIRSVRKQEHSRVSQVIMLTHNTRFHSEVSYDYKGEESPTGKFYRIRKFSPDPNRVEDCGQMNPIRSAYQELWDEVATARTRPSSPMPWLPNVLRRILESYFSTLGGQGNLYEIGQDLEASERALHDALIAWSHSGSHTIVDAEVYAQSSTSNDRWLDAFARIFENTSGGAHKGHYEMMMGEARKYVN